MLLNFVNKHRYVRLQTSQVVTYCFIYSGFKFQVDHQPSPHIFYYWTTTVSEADSPAVISLKLSDGEYIPQCITGQDDSFESDMATNEGRSPEEIEIPAHLLSGTVIKRFLHIKFPEFESIHRTQGLCPSRFFIPFVIQHGLEHKRTDWFDILMRKHKSLAPFLYDVKKFVARYHELNCMTAAGFRIATSDFLILGGVTMTIFMLG